MNRSGAEDAGAWRPVFGRVLRAGRAGAPGRRANYQAGLPFSLIVETPNRICVSVMRSATPAGTMIRVGDYEVVPAGGTENMSGLSVPLIPGLPGRISVVTARAPAQGVEGDLRRTAPAADGATPRPCRSVR